LKLVRAAKVGYMASSLAGMLMGFVLLLRPEWPAAPVCRAAGGVILLTGAAKLFGYFTDDLYRLAFQYGLALGSLTLLLGACLTAAPGVFSGYLAVIAGIYVIVNALFTVQTSVEAGRFGLKGWRLLLAGAMLSGLAGLLALVLPPEGAGNAARLVGAAFAADGLQNLLVAALTIRVRQNH